MSQEAITDNFEEKENRKEQNHYDKKNLVSDSKKKSVEHLTDFLFFFYDMEQNFIERNRNMQQRTSHPPKCISNQQENKSEKHERKKTATKCSNKNRAKLNNI